MGKHPDADNSFPNDISDLTETNVTHESASLENLGADITKRNPDLPPQDAQMLQDLLADLVFGSGRQPDFTPLELKIQRLEHQLYDPEEIINLLMPVISDLLNRKVLESKQSIIRAIVPIIDEVIVEKTQQDKAAMIQAIANLIPGAIEQEVRGNPDDLIEALAPAMGEIIKQQIRIERDAMVDALYPVIGQTIAKYMQEVVQGINSRVESALTPAGIRRKVQARIQGVSEAELIFRESMPFEVQAVFLIHKSSGLIITSVQKHDEEESLQEDLMAGMLTAVRSFASEYVLDSNSTSELKEIEYESFHIMMEVAGYCCLATVLKGEADQKYINSLRRSLGHIILQYDRDQSIHNYTGDPKTIDVGVKEELQGLLEYEPVSKKTASRRFPLALLSLLIIPFLIWGGLKYRQNQFLAQLGAIESQLNTELDVDPQLAVYPIQSEVTIDKGDRQIALTGKLPYDHLKTQAEEIIQEQVQTLENPDEWNITNDIVTVDLAPDPVEVNAEVQRLTAVLNRTNPDIIIATNYEAQQVNITGHFRTETQLTRVISAFNQIPGVENVLVASTSKAFPIDQRLYFGVDAATINPNDAEVKLPSIQEFLQQYPTMRIRIVGHIHPSESVEDQSPSLAEQRANNARDALVNLGIDPERLTVVASASAPQNLTQIDPPWLSRCVRFERIMEE